MFAHVGCRYGASGISDNFLENIWLPGVGTFVVNLLVTSKRGILSCQAAAGQTFGALIRWALVQLSCAAPLEFLPAGTLTSVGSVHLQLVVTRN